MARSVSIVYFASVKEAIGKSAENLDLQDEIKTASDLLNYLASLSPSHANAFENRQIIRIAFDQQIVTLDTLVGETKEIAIFPPMTGG